MGQEKKTNRKRKILSELVYYTALFICISLPFCFVFLSDYFRDVTMNQVLFHMALPARTDYTTMPIFILISYACLVSLGITFSIFMMFKKLFPGLSAAKRRRIKQTICIFPIVLSFFILESKLHVCGYFYRLLFERPSNFYELNYVDPREIDYVFPQDKKKNVVVIFLESMEYTYADPTLFGENLIPEMTRYSKDYISFNGFREIDGTQWTIASHVSMLCGIPLKNTVMRQEKKMVDPEANMSAVFGRTGSFLPNAYCVPQVFQKEGYVTSYLKGGDITFAGTDIFMNSHGVQRVRGLYDAPIKKGGDARMGMLWGRRDSFLYEEAKKEIKHLSAQNKPFFFMFLTVDTHFPDGYLDPSCPVSKDDFGDVAACADHMLSSFLSWMEKEGLFKTTVVAVIGDHLTMKNNVYETILRNPNREIINFFIGPAVEPALKTRSFTSVDFAPTLLEAAGVKIPGHRFGLGVSLLSEEKTLAEKLGLDHFQEHLLKRSKLYEYFAGEKGL